MLCQCAGYCTLAATTQLKPSLERKQGVIGTMTHCEVKVALGQAREYMLEVVAGFPSTVVLINLQGVGAETGSNL